VSRGRDLSEACFYDHCGECVSPACEDWCHDDEVFDVLLMEWVTDTEPEPSEYRKDPDGCRNDGTNCLCECHDRADGGLVAEPYVIGEAP
jgi:hypothetical protein